MKWMCVEGRTAGYLMRDGAWLLSNRTNEYLYFPKIADEENLFESKEEAYVAAMDYHETEGCKLYLELYPAPEKGEWKWIAQEIDGDWYGFSDKPTPSIRDWMIEWGEAEYICSSPPNPFWRKTLQ